MKNRAPFLIATLAAGLVVLATFGARGWGQDQPRATPQPPPGFPDLVGGLKATPGCLGVELAQTQSGKNLIFAWFENKKAVKNWYYSETHQQVMEQFFGHDDEEDTHTVLKGFDDDFGPIMAIASITMADKPAFEGTTLPISQIAIELYTPMKGGLFLGGRFAPKGVKVDRMEDYTPE